MLDKRETLDDLIRHYHKLCYVVYNQYIQLYYYNPMDIRILLLEKAYNRFASLFNLYVDLKRKRDETRKSDI